MCGIGGCVLPSGRAPDMEKLRKLAAAVIHRGPDDRGVEIVESVGLAHARLSIVDPTPVGHQPMVHESGRWLLTYNGEVFNHQELRKLLPPRLYKGHTDTETLLHALASWGEGAIPRCNGLFAFAALDLDRRRLLLVRDRFGVKPLYYVQTGEGLWFASELHALMAAGVQLRAEPRLLQHVLDAGWIHGPRTMFEGVREVAPGTIIAVDIDSGQTTERRWYEPDEAVDPQLGAELASLTRAQARDRLEQELRASVRRRLMGDVPVGTMCSGGLDSSLITALARDELSTIHAFNASVVDQPGVDEGPWAETVASHLGVELHTAHMTASSWRSGLVAAACHNEHPLVHESSVPMAQIAALARGHGVKVLLSGEAADELLGGYPWLHAHEFRDFDARSRRGEHAARGAYRWLQRSALTRRGNLFGLAAAGIEGTYAKEVGDRALAAYSHHAGSRRRLEAGLLTDLRLYLPHLLNRQDKNTMQHSIETRIPFLDPSVVSLAINLPLEMRIEPDRKAILREIAIRHLPRKVVERPKVGFGFDIDSCFGDVVRPEFLRDGVLRELAPRYAVGWDARVKTLSGQELMLTLTAEILCRFLIEGQYERSIEADLWRGGP